VRGGGSRLGSIFSLARADVFGEGVPWVVGGLVVARGGGVFQPFPISGWGVFFLVLLGWGAGSFSSPFGSGCGGLWGCWGGQVEVRGEGVCWVWVDRVGCWSVCVC